MATLCVSELAKPREERLRERMRRDPRVPRWGFLAASWLGRPALGRARCCARMERGGSLRSTLTGLSRGGS